MGGALLIERDLSALAVAHRPYPTPKQSGLSPRVRGNRCEHPTGSPRRRSIPACAGNQGVRRLVEHPRRSIPACAGEPLMWQHAVHVLRVYPRVCGGTAFCASVRKVADGLSPRVRGNPLVGVC